MQSPQLLNEAQVEQYHADGYLSLERLVEPNVVAALCVIYDRLFASRTGREDGNQFDLAGVDDNAENAALPQILNPSKYEPELHPSLLMTSVRSVAKQLLGPDAAVDFGHAIYKPPNNGAETPWHQDAAYWNPDYVYDSLSIWVPLQDVTTASGCMQFVPGSHRHGVFDHQSINNDPRIHGLELVAEETKQIRNPVSCPLYVGGATIHHNNTLHYAGPNSTNGPRRALILTAGTKAQPRDTKRSFPWLDNKQTARQARAEGNK